MVAYSAVTPLEESTVFEQNTNIAKSYVKLDDKCGSKSINYKFFIWELETPIIWINVIKITFLHVLAVWSFLTYPYLESVGTLIYASVLAYVAGFGVTAGVHRYWTHKSFKAKLPLRLILHFCYSLAGQSSIHDWVRDHRVHHKYSETDADPYNVKRGFFFAHVGWLMMKKHPEVLRKGRQIDCSDLFEDPLIVFHEKYFIWLKLLCWFILPSMIPPLLWKESWINSIKMAVIMRYTLNLNFTWSVNSIAHLWGNKPYDKNINPVENASVSIVSMGEGYHNYHHTFPWDYKASELNVYFNVTTILLNFFAKIGWAYDLKTVPLDLVKKVIENKGDGSHYKWGHEIPEEIIYAEKKRC